MNILRAYKQTRFFLWVNIIGLAIGLSVSIMLILFVINELSYDKHFTDHERIVRLNTIWEEGDNTIEYAITLKTAYTELPGKVPGVEAATQIYNGGEGELIYQQEHFQHLNLLYTVPEFFDVFRQPFLAGTPEKALESTRSLVITRRYADIIFGGVNEAINKNVLVNDQEYMVSAVVEELPLNTHFTFDVLVNIYSMKAYEYYGGLEFHTYYLIKEEASVEDVSASIISEYNKLLLPFKEYFNGNVSGITEKLTDIYLHSTAVAQLGKQNSMSFVWLLIGLAVFILLLAVSNFINLFMAQGESRMNEIGIRKANGALMIDIVKQFFSEVAVIVLVAFLLGLLLAIVLVSRFAGLIQKEISMMEIFNPVFILCLVGLFIFTVTLSAFYPSLYLSRFSPLEILGKRVKISKHKLIAALVVFQSVVTIVLLSYIFIINKQADYLKDQSLGYNPEKVMIIFANKKIKESYTPLRQELLNVPGISKVSAAHHIIGGSASGQGINLPENPDKDHSVNEYRVFPGLCELMEFELLDGEFFSVEEEPGKRKGVILNEAAVKILGLEFPVAGRSVIYKGNTEIVGVVKDFLYEEPGQPVEPLVLFPYAEPSGIYVKFEKHVSSREAMDKVMSEIKKFDPDYMLTSIWAEDVYMRKFEEMDMQVRIIFVASLLSLFIAMIGLLAIHLYSTIRRTKEIGIRRVNGAGSLAIFKLLTLDILKWIAIAGIIAIPLTYYFASEWLGKFANAVSLSWEIFIFPVFIQCLIALLATFGISYRALAKNPVEALKTE